MIENKIVAGCVGFMLGENYYLSKIAHDIEYNKYNLGNVVLLESIKFCIENGVKKFHFLWGEDVDYKIRYGGISHDLHYYVIHKKNFSFYMDWIKIKYKIFVHTAKKKVKKNQGIIKLYHIFSKRQ